MKKLVTLFTFSFLFLNVYSQVGGLSASKVGALCTATVPENTIEFEPFFGYALTSHYFDQNGIRQNLFSTSDSTLKFSGFGFRFTYGLSKNLEIGVSLPVDVSEVRFGAKYKLPLEGKFTMGLLAGYNTLIGNQVYTRRSAVHEITPAFVGGLIFTYKFSDRMCMDLDIQYQKHTHITSSGHDHCLFIDSEIGYYLFKNINFITGFSFNNKFYNQASNNSYVFTLNTGVAIERAENFILVLNAPFDLIGKNEYQTTGFGLALTIILD
ncbi:MAG: hypothetical protein JW729_05040 [Bacteroidales bacterium]|nr:hypothetical protein [Bacteroidales bacterium]